MRLIEYFLNEDVLMLASFTVCIGTNVEKRGLAYVLLLTLSISVLPVGR